MAIAAAVVGIDLHVAEVLCTELGVVVLAYAHIDPGFFFLQRGGPDACVFQCLPTELEQEALLGVHAVGFARGDFKEACIKAVYVFDKAPFAHIGIAFGLWVGVVEVCGLPAAGRDGADGFLRTVEEVPEGGRAVCIAGETAGRTYDGNGFFAPAGIGQCLLQVFDGAEGALDECFICCHCQKPISLSNASSACSSSEAAVSGLSPKGRSVRRCLLRLRRSGKL